MNLITVKPIQFISHEQMTANFILKTKHNSFYADVYPRYNKCELCDQDFKSGELIANYCNTYFITQNIIQKAHKNCLDFKNADTRARGFKFSSLIPTGQELIW